MFGETQIPAVNPKRYGAGYNKRKNNIFAQIEENHKEKNPKNYKNMKRGLIIGGLALAIGGLAVAYYKMKKTEKEDIETQKKLLKKAGPLSSKEEPKTAADVGEFEPHYTKGGIVHPIVRTDRDITENLCYDAQKSADYDIKQVEMDTVLCDQDNLNILIVQDRVDKMYGRHVDFYFDLSRQFSREAFGRHDFPRFIETINKNFIGRVEDLCGERAKRQTRKNLELVVEVTHKNPEGKVIYDTVIIEEPIYGFYRGKDGKDGMSKFFEIVQCDNGKKLDEEVMEEFRSFMADYLRYGLNEEFLDDSVRIQGFKLFFKVSVPAESRKLPTGINFEKGQILLKYVLNEMEIEIDKGGRDEVKFYDGILFAPKEEEGDLHLANFYALNEEGDDLELYNQAEIIDFETSGAPIPYSEQ